MKRIGVLGRCLLVAGVVGLGVMTMASDGACEPGRGKVVRPVRRGWGYQHEALRRAMDSFKENHPEEYARLEQLKQTDRVAYYKELGAYIPSGCVMSAKVLELDQECFKLSRQYHQARTEEEREVLKAELKAKVEASTDVMLDDLRKRLKRMQQQLETKMRTRDELVERRVNQLLKRRHRGGAHK